MDKEDERSITEADVMERQSAKVIGESNKSNQTKATGRSTGCAEIGLTK